MNHIQLDFSLADAELQGYRHRDDTLVLELKLWNDETIELSIGNVIALMDIGSAGISGMVELKESEFLAIVIARLFEIGNPPTLRCFGLLDSGGNLFFQIVTDGEPGFRAK